MANLVINKEVKEKTTVELKKEIKCDMNKLYYDNQFVCYVGCVGERDKQNAIKVFTKAIEASNGDVAEARNKLMTMANWAEADVDPDKSIEILGVECAICYGKGAIVDTQGNVICELNETLMNIKDTLSPEAIEAILVPIATDKIQALLDSLEEEWC